MMARDRYDSLLQYHAEIIGKGQLDWRFLKAQLDCESAMNPSAVSRAGAEGLAQAMPATWGELMPTGTSPFNPEHAIQFVCTYMRRLMLRFHHNRQQALAAYNAGPGRVQALIDRFAEGWFLQLPSETRVYVPRVTRRYDVLRTG